VPANKNPGGQVVVCGVSNAALKLTRIGRNKEYVRYAGSIVTGGNYVKSGGRGTGPLPSPGPRGGLIY